MAENNVSVDHSDSLKKVDHVFDQIFRQPTVVLSSSIRLDAK